MAMSKTLRLILGDQLNSGHSWFQRPRKDVVYVLMEMRQETDYVTTTSRKWSGFSPPCGVSPKCFNWPISRTQAFRRAG